ncbi:hypothetical protein UPYG_G00095560, partial [Umbra pygmaea]
MAYTQLEPINEGVLTRLTDCLLCRGSCRSCLWWCWEFICCPASDEEVEILGPFPAQTPSWLVDDCVDEDMDPGIKQVDSMQIPPDTVSNQRYSSSEMSRSTFSLARQLSSLDARRPSSPLVDVKPIEFWAMGPRKEVIQPLRRPHPPPDDYFRKLEPRLYSLDSSGDDVESLTDNEILLRYQLG